MEFIWSIKSIIIAVIVIAILISVFGFIKRNAILVLICILLVGGGSTALYSAWNTLESSASSVISSAEDVGEESGIYNKEKARGLKDTTVKFFKDLFD